MESRAIDHEDFKFLDTLKVSKNLGKNLLETFFVLKKCIRFFKTLLKNAFGKMLF